MEQRVNGVKERAVRPCDGRILQPLRAQVRGPRGRDPTPAHSRKNTKSSADGVKAEKVPRSSELGAQEPLSRLRPQSPCR